MNKPFEIIKATSEIGAGKPGAGNGPSAVLDELLQLRPDIFGKLLVLEVEDQNNKALDADVFHPHAHNIQALTRAMKILTQSVESSLENHNHPIILSGDHSNAIGAVSGFKNHYSQMDIGIIWVDAHLDLHSPYTTPSGNIHGMALNALIGMDNIACKEQDPTEDTLERWRELNRLGSKNISPKVKPENIVFIGIRDYEPEEWSLVENEGMHVFTPNHIQEKGIANIVELALEKLKSCGVIYVSFDVDSMDPSISAGTGTPVPGGLTIEEAEVVFDKLFLHPKVGAFEITEVNPSLEENNAMAKATAALLSRVL